MFLGSQLQRIVHLKNLNTASIQAIQIHTIKYPYILKRSVPFNRSNTLLVRIWGELSSVKVEVVERKWKNV